MGLKAGLKRIVGAERLSAMKGVACHYGYSALSRAKGEHKLDILSKDLKAAALISGDAHYFRGYYDLNYFSQDMSKFLCHKLPKDAEKNKKISCQVGYYDLRQKKYIAVAETQAWCWQQGSRLRWNPTNENQILFNDVDGTHYCARVYDLSEKKVVQTIPRALYDVTQDMNLGFSLNYSRLQRLRPGYGYANLPDETNGDNAPENDGLFAVDIQSGEARLLFSLRDLAVKCDPELKCEHYLNHISVSPDGSRIIFFHIYKGEGITGWNVNLYSCNIDGSDLILLESTDRASHYCWLDNENMLLTFHQNSGKEYYAFVNVKNGKKKRLNTSGLETDGHPNPINGTDLFITDTYPLKYGFQYLYQFGRDDKRATRIAKLYHDYRTRGERRCDLHPSISRDGKYISVDTTFRNRLRSVVIFKRTDTSTGERVSGEMESNVTGSMTSKMEETESSTENTKTTGAEVMPKVSIIVPMYNVGKYIGQCIESLTNQTLQDIEIILVDDGTPDDSGKIADQYAENDNRIHVIHKKNSGVSAARNDGLALATGEYVLFCDGDDWMDLAACEKLYKAAKTNNADISIGDVYMAYENKASKAVNFYEEPFVTSDRADITNMIRADIFRSYCVNPPQSGPAFGYGGPWNKLVKRSLLLENGILFDTRVKGVFDDILYTAHILACAKTISYIQYPMYYYRQLGSSITHSYKPNVLEINSAIFTAWKEFIAEYGQNGEFDKPFYACVIRRMDEAMKLYFVNSKNDKSKVELQNEFKLTIQKEPYSEAIHKVELNRLSKKQKLLSLLSRFGLVNIVWKIYA